MFFAEVGRRSTPGFEAIIGNPPYDVLSERETGRDLSALRAFVESDNVYEPTRRGKNNLYKLFICRAIDVLANGGRLGFITPMAVLGDDQAADIDDELLKLARSPELKHFPRRTIQQIESFQKQNYPLPFSLS